MSVATKIVCPNCKHEFDVESALKGDLEKQITEKVKEDYRTQMKDWQSKQELTLKQKEQGIEEYYKKQQLELQQDLAKKRDQERSELLAKIEKENAELIAALKKDNQEQTEKIAHFKKLEVDLLEKDRLIKQIQEDKELEMKRLSIQLQSELQDKIRKEEESKNELRFKEMEKQLEDQKRLAEEMRRKAEQGSMQLQGEVQELAIEDWLLSKFPYDNLEEIKKGARGGDCIQNVVSQAGVLCGKIYYESKRTKEWAGSWIEKFKEDMREVNADIGVIVTQSMPKDMQRFGQKDGIWVCTYEEFKALCYVLRDSLLRVNSVKLVQANKGDKMSILYDYLTSAEFRMSVETIVEGFSAMQDGLNKEKRSMQKLWKEREKQIEKVINSTVSMYGSVKGIAGSAIQDIKLLELETDFDESDE